MAKFSQRSKDALAGVEDPMVRLMTAAIVNPPHDFTVIEGLRTAATQAMYYTWGRTVVNPNTGPIKDKNGKVTKPFGAIVTNRDGVKVKSNHQAPVGKKKGRAVDICPFIGGTLDWDNDKAFHDLARHIKAEAAKLGIKIKWGGDWKNPYDAPHYELV